MFVTVANPLLRYYVERCLMYMTFRKLALPASFLHLLLLYWQIFIDFVFEIGRNGIESFHDNHYTKDGKPLAVNEITAGTCELVCQYS
jgi:hypothetical protein